MRAISQGKNEGKRARGQKGKRARGQEGKRARGQKPQTTNFPDFLASPDAQEVIVVSQ